MQTTNDQNQKTRSALERCAVFKIDLNGRFVYVDDHTEKLFNMPQEQLFGRSIKEFVDEDSYQTILKMLHQESRYESSFKSASLVFINSENEKHPFDVVANLNFIAGNPANYQIIVMPDHDHYMVCSENNADVEYSMELFELISQIDSSPDWGELLRLLLKNEKILQVGMYHLTRDDLNTIAVEIQPSFESNKFNFQEISEKLLDVAVRAKADIKEDIDPDDPQLVEAFYPLVCAGDCWGVIRMIYRGDIAEASRQIQKIISFLGNSLYSFICHQESKK